MKKGKKDKAELSADSNIREVLENYPNAVGVFLKNNLHCVGCAAAQFETLSDVANEFELDVEKLIEEIKEGEKSEKK